MPVPTLSHHPSLFLRPRRHFFSHHFLPYPLADLEGHLARFLVGVDDHVVTVQNLAVQDFHRQRILHQLLDGALQRTCSKVWIVAFGEEQLFCGVGQLQRNLAVGEQTAQILETLVYNLHQLFIAERTEDDDVVHAIQELRSEVPVQRTQHLLRRLLKSGLGANVFRLEIG